MQRNWMLPIFSLVLAFSVGCKDKTEVDIGAGTMKFELTSTAFREGETIPKLYTEDGKDFSPPLKWGDVPEQTKSLVLICDDPDAPAGTWVHWVLFNLPPDVRELSENVPKKETLGNGVKHPELPISRRSRLRRAGTAAGESASILLQTLRAGHDVGSAFDRADNKSTEAMKGHILAEGKLMGKYGR